MILEACVESLDEAKKAEQLGAHRIELCENLHLDGTTPSEKLIDEVYNSLSIPVNVLIRPRDGDFIFSEEEISEMKKQITYCKEIGVNGVVIGALTKQDTIDAVLTQELISVARPLQITFHKAIDASRDVISEFRKLIQLDIDRVLTSGGMATAIEGASTINEMAKVTRGELKILAAGKITNENLNYCSKLIQADEFHGRSIVGKLS